MIKRIVKMQFRPGTSDGFLQLFRDSQEAIRAFEGCSHLELLQDIDHPDTFFTISLWEDDNALQAYRNSSLFRRTWDSTRVLFNSKAVAWSTRLISNTGA